VAAGHPHEARDEDADLAGRHHHRIDLHLLGVDLADLGGDDALDVARARAGDAPPAAVAAPPDLGLLETMLTASVSNAVLFLPFVALAWILLRRSGDWERAVIREELAAEIDAAITSAEYEGVLLDRRWRTRRIGGGDRRAAKDLVNAQNELAFRKRRVRDRGGDPERDSLVHAWRAAIADARARLRRD
jgi:hypothetical protein